MVDSLVTRIEEAKTWCVAGAKDLREIIHAQFFYVHCNGFFLPNFFFSLLLYHVQVVFFFLIRSLYKWLMVDRSTELSNREIA
jgi:hypothetical protein